MEKYNYRNWEAIKKVDKPMSNLQTINYLIKNYNVKRLRDINRGKQDKVDKDILVIEGLKNVKKEIEMFEALEKYLEIEYINKGFNKFNEIRIKPINVIFHLDDNSYNNEQLILKRIGEYFNEKSNNR